MPTSRKKRPTRRAAPAKKKPGKHAGGRPSKFRPECIEQVRKLCAQFGATNEEIADFLGVTRRTLTNWMAEHPALAKAMKIGKAVTDERVVQSLYHRAVGYTHEAEKIFCHDGMVTRVTV